MMNIYLICQLTLEKEELVRALSAESSESSKLKVVGSLNQRSISLYQLNSFAGLARNRSIMGVNRILSPYSAVYIKLASVSYRC